MRLFRNPNIPFVKIRMISYIIAGILVWAASCCSSPGVN